MFSKLWRWSHLVLSLVSFIFLILASVTGIILAYDAVDKKANVAHSIEQLDTITLAQSITRLRKSFMEVTSITKDSYDQILVEAIDEEGNAVVGYVDPLSGKILGAQKEDSQFIQQVTAFHRSMFLKETGRFMVGVVSFLLLFIAATGLVLLCKRQQGWQKLFAKIKSDIWYQWMHVYFGRLMLVPIIIIAATGSYLFLLRFDLISTTPQEDTLSAAVTDNSATVIDVAEFPYFQQTTLAQITKVEFPFDTDPSEYFVIHLFDKKEVISQVTGLPIGKAVSMESMKWEQWSIDLHTGRTNIIWAIVLGLACLGILIFIYTGFKITLKRLGAKGKQAISSDEATIILLLGTENGSTGIFAQKVLKQLLAQGHAAFLGNMNDYKLFPKAEHIIFFTATYGDGEAPDTATKFLHKLAAVPQTQTVKCSVIAFGSSAYSDFCAYGRQVHDAVRKQKWAEMLLPVYTVNDRDLDEFVIWVNAWSEKTQIVLVSSSSYYQQTLKGWNTFTVMSQQQDPSFNDTFIVRLKCEDATKIVSGDLLAIYPNNDHVERLYSIGVVNDEIQLVVKLHQHGLGSNFLHQLNFGDSLKARIISNSGFHLPKTSSPSLLIANGTGIAPFLGMIEEHNPEHQSILLLAGFRAPSGITDLYQEGLNDCQALGKLQAYHFAYSRVEPKQYVMDILKQEKAAVLSLLSGDGVIMICGAKAMQHDIEAILIAWCNEEETLDWSDLKERKKIKTDCY